MGFQKAKRIDVIEPQFKPHQLVLDVPNEEVARALYAIFNYCPNADLLPEEYANNVRETMGDGVACGRQDRDEVIARGVTYKQFYQPKGVVR